MGSKVKPKTYALWLNGRKPPEPPDMMVRAMTKQGAINAAAIKTISCEYADQNLLYESTKAGVLRLDVTADPAQDTLPGVEQVATA